MRLSGEGTLEADSSSEAEVSSMGPGPLRGPVIEMKLVRVVGNEGRRIVGLKSDRAWKSL